LKDYKRQIVWLDYFNSELKRTDGRRVPLDSAIKAPTLDELGEACRRLNLDPQPQAARFPRNTRRASGYVSIKKGGTKNKLIHSIAKELTIVRGQKPK
jgi:signal recognition particle subunit SRP19